ncbi:MAG: hypothetical protein V7L20_26195 [Nostoc sp.]|uniref:hypothetical protein n=1 Tax=Nostoc sp. TaxID=1180 RepID=UPI002FFB284A
MPEKIQSENIEILVDLLHQWKRKMAASILFKPLEIALAAERFAAEVREEGVDDIGSITLRQPDLK